MSDQAPTKQDKFINPDTLPQVGDQAWDGINYVPVAVALSFQDCVDRGYVRFRPA